MLFAARALGGLLAGGIYPASLAYIADVTEPQERGKVMGLLGAASGVGMIFGPSVAGILAMWGLTVPFFATALAAIAFGFAGWFLLKESRAVSVHRLQARIRIVDPLRTPLGVMFILTMLVAFLISGFQGIFAYYLLGRFGMIETPSSMPVLDGAITVTGPTVMAILFTVMGIAGVLCQGVLVGRFIAFFGERKTILIGMATSSVSFFLLLLSPELISLMFFASIIAVGTGLVTPCINGLVSGKTDEERQGETMGVLGSYASLGRIAGPPAGGLAYDINLYLPYLISGILSAAGAIAVSLASRNRRKS
jgi:MFS family permease